MGIDKELLDILACPKCRQPVEERTTPDGEVLVCTAPDCRLAYPVRDGIPVMLVGEATPWSGS